jgi:cytochrome P450
MTDLQNSPIDFLVQTARRYGDVSRFRAGSRRGYLISHPDLIKEVLVTQQSSFIKEDSFKRIKNIMGDGLLTSEGAFYLRQRRLVQPAFHRQRIAAYGKIMSDYAADIFSRWHDGEEIGIFQEMNRLTLNIVAKTLFDTNLESDAKEIGEAATTILQAAPFSLDSEENYTLLNEEKVQEAKNNLDKIIYRLIDERQKSGKDKGDLLSMLMFSNEGNEKMSNEELRDEAVTILMAGHETVATALTWSWYLLSQNPECQEKLRDELKGVLEDRTPSVEDMPQLEYTKKILTESMRIYPPVWAVIRLAIKDCEIGNTRIPKDSVVLMSQYVLHHDRRFFENPEDFLPDRWTDEMQKNLPQFAYFPFGGGIRRCIGEQFAWMEGILLIASIAQKWQFQLVPNQTVQFEPLITLRPKYEIKMIVKEH